MNSAGCDSIITLNLVINTVDITVIDTSPVLTANASGAQYQWVDCEDDYSEIDGETGQSFTATSGGSYAVVVTENNCADTSSCYTVVVTGTPSISGAISHGVHLYPNPSSDILTVESSGIECTELIVYDSRGSIIFSSLMVGTDQLIKIDVSGFSEGVYFVSLGNTEGPKSVTRFIKTYNQ
jgi:hypothetical protein